MSEIVQNLQNLSDLLKSGAVSEDEFITLKRQLLAPKETFQKTDVFSVPSAKLSRVSAAGKCIIKIYRYVLFQLILSIVFSIIGTLYILGPAQVAHTGPQTLNGISSNSTNQTVMYEPHNMVLFIPFAIITLYVVISILSNLRWAGLHLRDAHD